MTGSRVRAIFSVVLCALLLAACAAPSADSASTSSPSAASVVQDDIIKPTPITHSISYGSQTLDPPPSDFDLELRVSDLIEKNPGGTVELYLAASNNIRWYIGMNMDPYVPISNKVVVLYLYVPDFTCMPNVPAAPLSFAEGSDGQQTASAVEAPATSVADVPCPSAVVFNAATGAIMLEMNGAPDPESGT